MAPLCQVMLIEPVLPPPPPLPRALCKPSIGGSCVGLGSVVVGPMVLPSILPLICSSCGIPPQAMANTSGVSRNAERIMHSPKSGCIHQPDMSSMLRNPDDHMPHREGHGFEHV